MSVVEPETPIARRAILLKRSLLVFWAVWLTVVFLTNLFDAGKALGLLPDSWAFASGNYRFVEMTTGRYDTPGWVNKLLFLGVVCWEGTAAVLFWPACATFRGRGQGASMRYVAFTVGLALWAAFAVVDEIFIAYAVEAAHVRLFTAQLTTLLAVELLPEGGSCPGPG